MPASLLFYSDSLLTQPSFSLPIGSADSAYTLSDMQTYESGGKTIYYYSGSTNKLSHPAVTPFDMLNRSYSPVWTDGLSTNYITYTDQGAPQWSNVRWDSWYSTQRITGSGGSRQGFYNICAAAITVEGVPFTAIGVYYNDSDEFSPFLIF